MAQRESEYVPYHERPVPWLKEGDRPPLAEEMREPGSSRPTRGPRRPRGRRSGCASGCGCLLVILLGFGVGAWVLVNQLPSFGSGALRFLVQNAINERITVNNRTVTVPTAWREPWRATAQAYGDAFDAGHIQRDHFMETLWATLGTVFAGGGEIPAPRIRELCTRMRAALPSDLREQLPQLPEPTRDILIEETAFTRSGSSTAPESATETPSKAGATWRARELLSPEERERQYDLRRDLRTTLSRRGGPNRALRLVADQAVIFDFALGILPYPTLMDEWDIDAPADNSTQVAMIETYGFSSPPALQFLTEPDARDSVAAVRFTTAAGSLNFWYEFQGIAGEGSTFTVLVDDAVRHSDTWPTSDPGGYIQDDWRSVRLGNLDAAAPSRIEIRTRIAEARTACRLVLDDLVFAPE